MSAYDAGWRAGARDVGEVRGERAPPGVVRAHRGAREVHALDQRIGRDDAAIAARRLPRRGIIADAEQKPLRGYPGDALANRRDQLVFGHTASMRRRSSRRASGGSSEAKTELPATSTSAPAFTARSAFSRPIPPSTSISQAGFRERSSARTSATFASARSMNG